MDRAVFIFKILLENLWTTPWVQAASIHSWSDKSEPHKNNQLYKEMQAWAYERILLGYN